MLPFPWPFRAEFKYADIISEGLTLIALVALLTCAHQLHRAYGRRRNWMLAELGLATSALGSFLDLMDEFLVLPQIVPLVIKNSLICAGSIVATVYVVAAARELVVAARVDGLTSLYNRRYMIEALGKEVLRAQRHSLEFSLAFIDVNDFRKVNNVLGHMQGDAVLECVSQVITATSRGSDFASRWGGDEFVVLLTGTGKDGAKAFSSRFHDRMDQAILQLEMPLDVKVSSGFATYPEDGLTGENLIKVADYRMYQVKRSRTVSLKRSSFRLRRP